MKEMLETDDIVVYKRLLWKVFYTYIDPAMKSRNCCIVPYAQSKMPTFFIRVENANLKWATEGEIFAYEMES